MIDMIYHQNSKETMGEKYKNDLEDKNTPSKQSLADRFFKRFVENEDQINFTNEDVIKEIKNLEKNFTAYSKRG